ncbi:MAG: purine-cytosine permease-like transporter, partial [Alphaproteobacteria bacterium]
MSDKHTVSERIEDHALERVPPGDRHNWLQISWNTAGIVTTLIQIYIGATITFMAGMELGLLTGLCVAIIG